MFSRKAHTADICMIHYLCEVKLRCQLRFKKKHPEQLGDCIKIGVLELPWLLSGLRAWCCLCEDSGLIPGLSQCVKGPARQQAAAWAADVAQIRCCRGCVAGLSRSSDLTPGLGTYIRCKCGPLKKKLFLNWNITWHCFDSWWLITQAFSCKYFLDSEGARGWHKLN